MPRSKSPTSASSSDTANVNMDQATGVAVGHGWLVVGLDGQVREPRGQVRGEPSGDAALFLVRADRVRGVSLLAALTADASEVFAMRAR